MDLHAMCIGTMMMMVVPEPSISMTRALETYEMMMMAVVPESWISMPCASAL
jgi:hypothetical protein